MARARLAVAAVVATFAVATAASGASAATVVTGGTPAERALVRQILGGMAPLTITEVKLGPVPRSAGDWPRSLTNVAVKTRGGAVQRGTWESWLLTSAFADLSRKRHLPLVFGYHDPDRISGRATPPPATDAGAAALDAQVRQMVADTAGTSGVQIVSLQILRPDGLAYALVLTAADPAAYMKHQLRDLLTATRTARSAIDGSYVALTDATGAVVWMSAGSARAGAGTNYARHDLAGCNPIVNFGVMQAPPPCPAA